jgi:hypothetical protein
MLLLESTCATSSPAGMIAGFGVRIAQKEQQLLVLNFTHCVRGLACNLSSIAGCLETSRRRIELRFSQFEGPAMIRQLDVFPDEVKGSW